jgi:peptidoglycan/xylan/chitin deacetylase (PgdA/CDA1 family)
LKRGLFFILVGVLFLMVCVSSSYLVYQLCKSRTIQISGEILNRVETDEKVIALTFDDGPTAGFTEEILDTLAALETRATFFLVGAQMKRRPELTKLIVEGGHEVGNHSFSHHRMVFVSYESVAHEVEATNSLIRAAGFEGQIHFRPPYYKKFINLPRYLADNGIVTITSDLDPETSADSSDPEAMAHYVAHHAAPGSIILLHVMFRQRSASMASVPLIIKRLERQGYEFVTISDLISRAVQ